MAGAALLEDELDEDSGAADEELDEGVAVALEEELPGWALLEELTGGGLDELPGVGPAELPVAELPVAELLWSGTGGALLAPALDDDPVGLLLPGIGPDVLLEGCGGGRPGGRASSRHGGGAAQACDGYGG